MSDITNTDATAAGGAITDATARARRGDDDRPVAAGRIRTAVMRRIRDALADQDGMSTVEYAVGTVAAAAFGALLYTVVTGGEITEALTGIIDRALNTQ